MSFAFIKPLLSAITTRFDVGGAREVKFRVAERAGVLIRAGRKKCEIDPAGRRNVVIDQGRGELRVVACQRVLRDVARVDVQV